MSTGRPDDDTGVRLRMLSDMAPPGCKVPSQCRHPVARNPAG
jgi:hypothetical protein